MSAAACEFALIDAGPFDGGRVKTAVDVRKETDQMAFALLNARECPECVRRAASWVDLGAVAKARKILRAMAYHEDRCWSCLSTFRDTHVFEQKFWESHRKTAPAMCRFMRKYPFWKKYCLVGSPDTPVRLVRVQHLLPQHITDYYNVPNATIKAEDVSRWLLEYQVLVLDALPLELVLASNKKPTTTTAAGCDDGDLIQTDESKRTSIAQIIMDYADPSMFTFLGMRLHTDILPSAGRGWLIMMVNLNPENLITVQGWSPHAIQQLSYLPAEMAYHFATPLGFIHLLDYIPKTNSDPP